MTLRQFLLIIKLRWWLVLGVFALILSAALAITLYMPKRYTATTSLILDLKTDPLLTTLAPALAAPAYMATQAEVLQSQRLAGRVVRTMGLAQSPSAVAQWREETGAKVPLETYFGELLRRGLDVKPGRGNQILNINFVGADPNFAAAAANTYAKAYIDLSVELRTSPAKENASFFDERMKQLRSELEAAQAKVDAFQQGKGMILSNERFDQEMTRLANLESAYAGALAEQASTSSVARHGGAETSTDVANSTAVQGLKSQLAAAETRLVEASQTLGSSHPVRIQLDAQIAELKEQLQKETRRVGGTSNSANRVASQKLGELRSLVAEQKRTILNLRAARDEGSMVIRELEAAQRAFDAVNQRRSQLSMESQADQAGARVLSPATAPLEPSSPVLMKNMVAAALGGLVLAFLAAVMWERIDGRVRNEDDLLAAVEGVPVLGVISSKLGGTPLVRRLPARSSAPRLTMSEGQV